jgi:hypothetical protein
MARKAKRKQSVVKSARRVLMTAAEHDSLLRSVSVLSSLHLAKTRVSKRARKSVERLEARILDQVESFDYAAADDRRLSGASWVNDFPDSKSTSALAATFAVAVDNFIAAIKGGGATLSIGSTYRPVERAHLMHYAWKVARKEIAAADVPAMTGVDIEWVHATDAQSVQAAKDMVAGYGIVAMPSLTSRHTQKRAIDMTVSWTGTLTIKKADGNSTSISTTPRTGENTDLIGVGAGYGVIKAVFAGDPPHWSDDGH